MILCCEKYIYNWVADDIMLWEIYVYLSRWWYYVVWNIFIIGVADDTMLCEIYL